MAIQLMGRITEATTIATGRGIRELDRLVRVYGPGRWRKRKGAATVRLPDGTLRQAEVHCVRSARHRTEGVQGEAHFGAAAMNARRSVARDVVCLSNAGYRASLIPRRIYRVVPDAEADKRGLSRGIDESGEDYLYPRKLFSVIELPKEAAKRFARSPSDPAVQRTARAVGRR